MLKMRHGATPLVARSGALLGRIVQCADEVGVVVRHRFVGFSSRSIPACLDEQFCGRYSAWIYTSRRSSSISTARRSYSARLRTRKRAVALLLAVIPAAEQKGVSHIYHNDMSVQLL